MYSNLIERIHLELTNRCNAACPSCARTGSVKGNVRDYIANAGWHDISLNDIKKLCENPILSKLRKVHLCGNFGDPAVAPDFFDIVHYFIEKDIRVTISTNGHPHSPEKWASIAHENVAIAWHIDGDEDTNHLYRVGTDFNRIIENAKGYINAGGIASWVIIAFKHNEHVIDKCKDLSEKLGFKKFRIKKSYRFGNANDKRPVSIELPTNQNLINEVITNRQEVPIVCNASVINEFYLSSDGDVFPCCWTGTYFWRKKYNNLVNEFEYLIDHDINIHTTDIGEILLGYKEKEEIYNLVWQDRIFRICNKNCGTNKCKDKYIDD